MELTKSVVSRDDRIYEAWPDVALTAGGRLICVFSECEHHGRRNNVRVMYCISDDRGRTWSPKRALTGVTQSDAFWNCARVSVLRDGRVVIACDRLYATEENPDNRTYLWFSADEGGSWSKPVETPVCGIVPTKLTELSTGRWLLGAHRICEQTGKLAQAVWYSDDRGAHWSPRITVGSDPRYHLCEASLLELPDGTVVAHMRENSGRGYDCFKSISRDHGETWDGVYPVPLPGCHRPVAGLLSCGKVLITCRLMQGGGHFWGENYQNFICAVSEIGDAVKTDRADNPQRIFHLDTDRNLYADTGYSGWVQFDDGEIFVVNYILDDAPKAYIRSYRFREKELLPLVTCERP